MEMTRVSVLESQLLQQYVAALYPLEIETHGLYQALRSPALERFCQSQFEHVFRGNCKSLSLELQLSAYRSVLNCVESCLRLAGISSRRVRGQAKGLGGCGARYCRLFVSRVGWARLK